MWGDLRTAIWEAGAGLPSLDLYPVIKEYLKEWLRDRSTIWEPMIHVVLGELGYPPGSFSAPIVDVAAAWVVLVSLSGVLDTYVDQDKNLPGWQSLGRDAGTMIALAVLCDCFALVLRENTEGRARAAAILGRAIRRSALGQAQDIQGVDSLAGYERMIVEKSGVMVEALLDCLCSLYAERVDDRVADALRRFGRETGVAIQIVNDWLGIFRVGEYSQDHLGDLGRSKLTYPILYGLNTRRTQSAEFQVLWTVEPAYRDIARLRTLLDELGADRFLRLLLGSVRMNADSALADMRADTRVGLMRWFDRYIIGRLG